MRSARLADRWPTLTSLLAKLASVAFAPRNGEASLDCAVSRMRPLRALQALCSAEPALAAPQEPPEPAVRGKRLSPSSTLTDEIGTPRLSAAIWVRMV
jgi:hypothetical protein